MNNHKNIFRLSLLLATVIPIIFFTLVSQMKQPNLGIEVVNYTLLFLGTAHVPTTAFFYNLQEFLFLKDES